MQSLFTKTVAITALAIPMTAVADHHKMGDDKKNWNKMLDEAVSASEVLTGDVTNVLNPVGTVKELILTEKSGSVEYVLYDVPFPYHLSGTGDGFVAFDNVSLQHGGYGDLNVRFESDSDAQAPEQLTVTAEHVHHRAVSRLIGEPVVFGKDEVRTLSDILVHPENGKLTHFIVEMNPDAIFSEEPRAIPASKVSIAEDGGMSASITLKEADKMKAYGS